MNLIRHPTELASGTASVHAAIGVFDGVHRGHQAVIRQALAEARQHGGLAVVITFDRHPQSVVAPQRAPSLIQPLPRKLASIAALGVETTLLYHFDEAFSRQPAEVFANGLAAGLRGLRSISVGANFAFGYQRDGNVAVLKQHGARLGFAVLDAPPVMHGGLPISSTRIRQAIRAGELAEVNAMLGRPYAVCGPVVEGDRLGRRLGFPTANVAVDGLVLPPTGVYAAQVGLEGRWLPAVLNLGARPTIRQSSGELRFEVHLLDWSGDLYGAELEVRIGPKLREERKFPSLDELTAQIGRDVAQAQTVARAMPV